MTVTPLFDNVLVRPQKDAAPTGLIIPESADKSKPERGEVIAIGFGKRLRDGSTAPPVLSVGQSVLFKKYAPDEVKVDSEDLLIIREEDILAVIS